MEHHQPSMLQNTPSIVVPETPEKSKQNVVGNFDNFIGVLDVCIHQARDIHNICIYHKQDVYAKFCLTDRPEKTVSTQIINGGGKNPVFNQSLYLNVRTINSSLRCEIWMLSRVKNYLEDQLLGFVLVPLPDVLGDNGKAAREFALTSSDLVHSPAGFVQLTLTYAGASPEILEVPSLQCDFAADVTQKDSEVPDTVSCELEKIEFPDPKIINENEIMVAQYLAIPRVSLEGKSSGPTASSVNTILGEPDGEGYSAEDVAGDSDDASLVQKTETPLMTCITAEVPLSVSNPIHSESFSGAPEDLKSPSQYDGSESKVVGDDAGEAKHVLPAVPGTASQQPIVDVTVEQEEKVVQKEIVDMYKRSMQEFTEALAKMKLPLDIETGSSVQGVQIGDSDSTENSGSDEKAQQPESGPSPRVFYGSRAFY